MRIITFLFYFLLTVLPVSKGQISLSQNSNYHIETISTHQTFISSIEGLNVVDGLHTKVYKPSTHNMYGKNIQSDFYEVSSGLVWFCTYKAIHAYNPQKDDFEYYFIYDKNGVKIKSDYRIIGLYDDQLWVYVSNELHIWNIDTKESEKVYLAPCASIESSIVNKTKDHVVLLCPFGVHSLALNDSLVQIKNITKEYCTSALFVDNDNYILGTSKGELLIFNRTKNKPLKSHKIGKSQINRINSISGNNELVVACQDQVIKYDLRTGVIMPEENLPGDFSISKAKLFNFVEVHDNIGWMSRDGIGVDCYKYDKSFKHKLRQSDFTYPSIIGIFNFENSIVNVTKSHGIFVTDLKGEILFHCNKNEHEDKLDILKAIKETNKSLILKLENGLYRFDIEGLSIEKLRNISIYQPTYVPALIQLDPQNYLCSTYDSVLYNLEILGDSYSFVPIDDLKLNTSMITLIKKIDSSNVILSANEETLVRIQKKYDTYEIKAKYNIKDGVNFFNLENDSIGYLGNSNGLYEYNTRIDSFVQILDVDKLLAQTIYSVYLDSGGNIWCTSNSGILKYDLNTKTVHQFGEENGVQSLEFNTDAHLKLEDGTIFVGGVNGLNVYHPDSISLSNADAPVMVTDYKVNDNAGRSFGQPIFLDSIQLPFDQNTISFSFHAIDYGDPEATRVKYKLIGQDEDYVMSNSADGFARYANLNPGEYTFSLIGSNSDGIWNKESKTINIKINPPWYATWWARSLMLFLIGGLTYLTFKSYYNRKLKEKDLALREANLTISKQTALSEERTRIASEMHDDLGGGLTTIKFLSQKVLRKSEDEGIKTQVKKIVNQSETLVNNMSEIIWAMNAGFDTLTSLVSYSRRFAHEYLETHGIELSFKVEGSMGQIKLSGTERRNIFLVIKEVLHNAVKHSKCTQVNIRFEISDDLKIIIKDNGVGITESNELGNGLKNMMSRMQNIGGSMSHQNKDGLIIELVYPNLKRENSKTDTN